MKIIKVIIWIVIGFIIGFSVIPIIERWKHKDELKIDISNAIYPCKTRPKEELIPLVKQGDAIAYDALSIYFSCSENSEELLPYAFLMANKYNYKKAYYDVFDCFWSIYAETGSIVLLDNLDATTRNLALEYLKKGAELGENNCQYRLGCFYFEGKYFKQDTILGQELLDKGNIWK